jgi:hypothetical protein
VKYRPAHRAVARRLVSGLIAVILGGVGSLAVATPSRADMPCALTFTTTSLTFDERGNPRGPYWVYGSITNTASVTSIWWVVYISFPNRLNQISWDLQPMPMYGDGWYSARDYNKAIPPGQSATFRFLVTMTSPEISGMPNPYFCSIS